jgi:large subunit ribosomal protein L23
MSKTVIVKPVLTEKSLNNKNVYAFIVDRAATKPQIKVAIEELYKVTVGAVNVLVSKGKVKLVGKKRVRKTETSTKKAYITLKKGKIEDFVKNN